MLDLTPETTNLILKAIIAVATVLAAIVSVLNNRQLRGTTTKSERQAQRRERRKGLSLGPWHVGVERAPTLRALVEKQGAAIAVNTDAIAAQGARLDTLENPS